MMAAAQLARASSRTRWRSAMLLGLVFAATSISAVTGLAARSALTKPWDQLFEATHGAHVRITTSSLEEARAVASTIPGVVEVDTSRSLAFETMRTPEGTFPIALLVSSANVTLDRQVAIDEDGPGLAIEYSQARALGLSAGDPISLQRADGSWASTRVGAVVSSVASPPYPQRVPGLGFMDIAELRRLGLPEPQAVSLGLRLDDPQLVGGIEGSRPGQGVEVSTWDEVRTAATVPGRAYQAILDSFSVLLLVCAGALVVVTIGGRLVVDRPLFRLLSAAGSTPAQTATAVAFEHAIAAGLGALVGVGVAAVGAGPVLAAAGPNLGASTPGVGLPEAVTVLAIMVAAAGSISWIATYRSVMRLSSVDGDGVVPRSRIGHWALQRRLPLGVAIGIKDTFARPARATVAAIVVALAVVAGVAALNMEATFANERTPESTGAEPLGAGLPGLPLIMPETTTDEGRLRPLVYGLEALLVLVAGATIVLATSLDSRERQAESAAQLAVGFTPRQLAAARASATALTASLGTAVGIPLGVGFFFAAYVASNGSGDGASVASPLLLLFGGGAILILTVQLAWMTTTRSMRNRSLTAALRLE